MPAQKATVSGKSGETIDWISGNPEENFRDVFYDLLLISHNQYLAVNALVTLGIVPLVATMNVFQNLHALKAWLFPTGSFKPWLWLNVGNRILRGRDGVESGVAQTSRVWAMSAVGFAQMTKCVMCVRPQGAIGQALQAQLSLYSRVEDSSLPNHGG
jgi:hypothetical protein